MSNLKFGNSEVGEGRLSRRPRSFTSRFLGMTGAAALVIGGAGSVFIGATAASASTTPNSFSSYTIGAATAVPTVALSNSVASSSATVNNLVTYTINFVAPVAIASGGTIVVGVNVGNTSGTIAQGVTLSDSTGGFGPVDVTPASGSNTPASTGPSTLTLSLPSGVSIKSGDSVSLVLTGVANPIAATTTDTVTVTPGNAVGATSASFAITAASTTTPAATPTATATNLLPGAVNSNYTFSGFTTTAVDTTGTNTLNLTAAQTTTVTGSYTAPVFPTNAGQYTLKDSAGNSYPVTGVLAIAGGVAISSSTTIPSGTVLTLSVTGVQNPSATTAGSPNTTYTIDTNGATASSSLSEAAIAYGSAVTGASLSATNLTVNGTSNDTVNFVSTSAIAAGSTNTISVGETGSTNNVLLPTVSTDYIIQDNTTGNSASPTLSITTGTTNHEVLTLPTSFGIAKGDKVSVEILGVTNGATAGAVSDFAVSTSADPLVVNVPQFTLLATAPTTSKALVTVSPNTAGATASYTLQGITVKTAYGSGATMEIQFSSGTFPTVASAYTITDMTNSSNSETPSSVSFASNSTNDVTLTLSNALPAGDQVVVSVAGVINTALANTYTVSIDGGLEATTVAAASFPTAAMSYPNGAFVQSSAGQIDVIAGGYGFGIPTMSSYSAIAATDSSTVVAGSEPMATAPRAGTLIQVVGSAGIWVVGTNGMIYQFSSMSQFLADGYSPMQVVVVPSSGGLTVGTGVPPTAATTLADGSIQNFGGTLYVYDGGQAFGIPTPAAAASIEASTGSMVITGAGSTPASANIADGSILQTVGSGGIYVTSAGTAYQFSSVSQLTSNGYTGMYTVMVPSLGSLPTA